MADPNIIKNIMDCVMLPVFGQIRIGHEVEAHIMQQICANGIHEYDKMPAASAKGAHIVKRGYKIPFICPASSLGEALQRISEGASMIHTKGGEAEHTPNVAYAVTELTDINDGIKAAVSKLNDTDELKAYAEEIEAPVNLLMQVARLGRLPVPLFGYGGVEEPTDAAYLKSHGCDGIIIGPAVLSTMDAQRRAEAMIFACQHPKDYAMIARLTATWGAVH
ncbi:Pyridoxal 5'-phosphate synthase subunit snz1 [Coemansia sp. RSA 2559]|nr:Pyridoxal 5'-phosphate synthase subunit snz1 [Coemansia sp. RSA 2559]